MRNIATSEAKGRHSLASQRASLSQARNSRQIEFVRTPATSQFALLTSCDVNATTCLLLHTSIKNIGTTHVIKTFGTLISKKE